MGTENFKKYSEDFNLMLIIMGENPASESDIKTFFDAGIVADGAAEDFAFYRKAKV